jgi:hypothetical protein
VSRRMAASVAVALAVIVTGCGHDKPVRTSGTPSGTSSRTPSASASGVAKDDALAAYRGMWNAYVEAAKTSDPDAPALRTYASDDALKLIVGALVTNRAQKKVVRGDLKIDPRATVTLAASAPTATVTDCVDSTRWLEYKASGGLWDDKSGGKHRTTATVKSRNGSWKVTSFTLEGSGTC